MNQLYKIGVDKEDKQNCFFIACILFIQVFCVDLWFEKMCK